MQPRPLSSMMPGWTFNSILGGCASGVVLTALLGDVVFALGHREIGLADAVLAVEELADDAVRIMWTTGGDDGEGTAA